MGFKFKKQIKLGKFFKINLTKNGISSITLTNNKGLSANINKKGKLKTTVSAKGTGMYYSKDWDLKNKKED